MLDRSKLWRNATCNDSEVDMDRAQQTEMANSFLARHRAPPVLLLPNVWDALSARLFVAAGFDALATTSGGVAWALGYPDGELADNGVLDGGLKVRSMVLPDTFLDQDSPTAMYAKAGLDSAGIVAKVFDALGRGVRAETLGLGLA